MKVKHSKKTYITLNKSDIEAIIMDGIRPLLKSSRGAISCTSTWEVEFNPPDLSIDIVCTYDDGQ